jgi:hypothetical protein
MKNKNLIIGGVIVAGIIAYYFYNKNKGGVAPSSAPSSASSRTMGGNLTDCKNIQTIPCLVAPCPKICADNIELPKKGGSPAVGTSSVFDCEKAKVENKQLYEQIKNTVGGMSHFSEQQKNNSICSMMRDSILGFGKVGLK